MLRTAVANAPRLRATRSLGSLRASAQAMDTAASSSTVPPMPARSLVSSVLLSRDAYDRSTLVHLKAECKQRGLTTSGRKADIVARLLTDDAQSSGSGLVTLPTTSSSTRANSTLAGLRGSAKGGKSVPKTTQATPTEATASHVSTPSRAAPHTESTPPSIGEQAMVGDGASIAQPKDIQPGAVAAPAFLNTDAGIVAPEILEADSNPPGVPPAKEPEHPETFKVEIPYESEEVVPGPEIPIVTMYTNRPAQEEALPPLSESGPKVHVASAQETVSHASAALETDAPAVKSESSSSSSSESSSATSATAAASSATATFTAAAQSLQKDMGLENLSKQAGKVVESMTPAALSSSSSSTTTKKETQEGTLSEVKESITQVADSLMKETESTVRKGLETVGSATTTSGSSSTSSSSSSSSSKSGSRKDLNPEEKRGLYVLGGLVFGGLTLGSLMGGSSKSKKEKKH